MAASQAALVFRPALVGLAPLILGACGPDLPPHSGSLVDAAEIFPEARERALASELEAFERETGTEIVVATVPSLQGYSEQAYGEMLATEWSILGAEEGLQMLLLVAPEEGRAWVGMNSRFENRLPRTVRDQLLQQAMLPPLQQGDVAGGIEQGVRALMAALRSGSPTGAAE